MKETPDYKFPKKEKLTQHHLIERMFASTHPSFSATPVRMVYFFTEQIATTQPVQVLMLVSKRNLKLAHQRNYVKRCMREAYRLNKAILYEKLQSITGKSLIVMFIYLSKEHSDFSRINQSFIKIFTQVEFSV